MLMEFTEKFTEQFTEKEGNVRHAENDEEERLGLRKNDERTSERFRFDCLFVAAGLLPCLLGLGSCRSLRRSAAAAGLAQ